MTTTTQLPMTEDHMYHVFLLHGWRLCRHGGGLYDLIPRDDLPRDERKPAIMNQQREAIERHCAALEAGL